MVQNSKNNAPNQNGTPQSDGSFGDSQQASLLPEKSKPLPSDGYMATLDNAKVITAKSIEAGDLQDDGRETWGKKVDFLLSIIGFAVDLANVWRFPYLCFKNGGGAFLIPYFSMLIFGGIPLFFMELVLGQFHRKGAVSVWAIAPIFKGIGMAECLIAYLVAFYYNVIIAWSVYFLFASILSLFPSRELPWTSCDNDWNTYKCIIGEQNNITDKPLDEALIDFNCTYDMYNMSGDSIKDLIVNGSATAPLYLNKTCGVSGAEEYYERHVLGLHLSEGLHDIGPPRWQLVICLLIVFTLLYLSLWKGVKSSGKVVWVTATMPYVVLAILLCRGILLPGALEGIKYFITPRISKLGELQVWADAAVQIFYSVGAGFGVHIAYASYNKFTNNCYLDCLATACINSFTSIFSGIVVFCYLGYMAQERGMKIEDVNQMGPGLVFKVYPEAISLLPGSSIWSIIFFLMLLTLGIDSAMGGLEAVLTGIRDELSPQLRKKKYSREIITFLVVGSAGCFAIQNVTNGGMYLFTMWDTFAAGTSLLLAVFSQAIAVSWFYGMDQFCADIKKMLGFTPCIYWRLCWKFISPLFLLIVITASVMGTEPLTYDSGVVSYVFPWWGNAIGWLIAITSMSLVPGYAIYKLISTPGSLKQRIAICISPHWEHEAIKEGKPVKRFQIWHWLSLGGSCSTQRTDYAHSNGQPV